MMECNWLKRLDLRLMLEAVMIRVEFVGFLRIGARLKIRKSDVIDGVVAL